MSLENPTNDEYMKMYETIMSVESEIDGVTYSTLTMLSEHFQIPLKQLAGRALFLGMQPAINEIVKLTRIKE